ncbi:MAG: hypothetical protein V4643_10750 [Bacteroidota bacterium]
MNTQTTTEQTATNSLVFKTSKMGVKEDIFVSIRLNDECKNGHQDFAITGDIYEAGKPKTDRYHIAGGCIHEEIAKSFPEFTPFIKLHLCDYKGIPMHCSANGFYHLRQGFNSTKIDSPRFQNEYCEYYRITNEQFAALNKAENEIQFAFLLERSGIFEQWEQYANKAIEYLETLTGKKFLVDSTKSQYHAPTQEQREQEAERVRSGYYTPQQKAIRADLKAAELLTKLEQERDKVINKAKLEFEVKLAVLKAGGKKAVDNCIFYNHTNQVAFNWKGYDQLSTSELETVLSKLVLPEGVTIDNRKK